MNKSMIFEKQYKALLKHALNAGEIKSNRTGIYTHAVFNQFLTIDLNKGFPILTGKKIFFNKALTEYNWMMFGLTTLTYLHDNDVHWWDEYANDKGDLRLTYGSSLRNFNNEFDQLDYINSEIRMKSRRAHISLWEPHRLKESLLPSCLTGFTFMQSNSKLNMTLQIRSSDLFLGLPYDIILAALLLINIAKWNELKPNMLGIQITDAHIYENHINQVFEYIKRKIHTLPVLYTHPETKEHSLVKYIHEPLIKAKLNN